MEKHIPVSKPGENEKERNVASQENRIAKSRPVLYWAIDAEMHSIRALYEHPCIKTFIESTTMTIKRQNDLQVTIIFINGVPTAITDEETKILQHASASNMVIPLQLEFLVIDERCAAIDVSILNPALRSLVRNKHPHMTFGLATCYKARNIIMLQGQFISQMIGRCVGDPPAKWHIRPYDKSPPKRFELEGLIVNGYVRAHY